MPKLAIVDWEWLGHAPLFSGQIALSFHQRGWKVRHISRSSTEASAWFRNELGIAVDCRELACVPAPRRRPWNRRRTEAVRHRWDRLTATFSEGSSSEADFVFFPWVDHWLDRWLKPATVHQVLDSPWGALLLNTRHYANPEQDRRRNRRGEEFHRALSDPSLRLLATLDETSIETLAGRFPQSNVVQLPDFIEPNPTISSCSEVMNRAKASGRRVLLSTGVMQRRKGFLKLLQIAEQNLAPQWQVVLSGVFPTEELSDSERDLLRSAKEGRIANVLVHDGFLADEAAINAEIAAADLVFLGYENWYQSSNILTRAAQWRRPVISCATGVLAERTRRHQLGWVLANDSAHGIAALLRQIDHDALERQATTGGYEGLRRMHDVAELPKTFDSVLRRGEESRYVA